MSEDLADVVAAGAQDSDYGIACRAFEGASHQSAIGFHVPVPGLKGAAPLHDLCEHGRDAIAHSADEHARHA